MPTALTFFSAGVLENIEIVTEQAASKPLRQSPAVSKPVRKPVETSLDKDDEEEEEEEVDADVQDVEDDPTPAGNQNSVI